MLPLFLVDMINFNGTLVDPLQNQLHNNRAFLFGDAVFETLKVVDNRILFFEDHYFRLMSSMRILRMEIPMTFTMEFLEEQIFLAVNSLEKALSYRVRFTVYRDSEGLYLPKSQNTGYLITANPLENALYTISPENYEVDLYKDFYISKQLLSSVKSTNRALNITASIYAQENDLQNCILLNDAKNVAEAINGNIFMLTGNTLTTPPVSEGCIGGILRKQILEIAKKIEGIQVVEQPISPFDLQKADELFLTNIIAGIQPITKYRKKEFSSELAQQLLTRLNAVIRLG